MTDTGSLLDGIDLSKPCLVWPVLQQAYYSLLLGERETTIKFDGQREVTLQSAKADALLAEITRLKAECDASQGKRTRFAIRAGWRS